jgi:hypothetical protein
MTAISISCNEREYKSEVAQLNQFLLWKQLKIMKNSILCLLFVIVTEINETGTNLLAVYMRVGQEVDTNLKRNATENSFF